MKPFCSSPIVFYTNGSRDRSRFSRWLHWSWSRRGAWVIRCSQAEAAATAPGRRSGSCHRDLWPADMMIRSAAARLGGAKSATGVFALALTRWRLASTDAGRKEALGLHELECRRLQAGTTSGFVEYFCFATGAGAECRVVIGSRGTTHSNDLNASNSKTNLGQNRNQVEKRFRKSKTHKLESYQLQPVFVDLLLEKP